MVYMSFNDIKYYINKKYPGKYTDEEIELMPIIIVSETESVASHIQDSMITVQNTNEKSKYDFCDPSILQPLPAVIFVEAF